MDHRRVPMLVVLAGLLLLSPARPARAQGGFDLEGMKKLYEEGTEHFLRAGDTRLDRSERNREIKLSHDLLMEAYEMIDKWCELHPEDIDSLEDYCREIARMRYFLRKEAPNGVLNDEPPTTFKPPADWPPEPPPDLDEPALPRGERPPAPPPGEEKPDPAAAHRDSVKRHLEYAKEYARKHPYDEVGLRDIYLDIIEHAPPGSEAYLTAMKRFSEINARLKKCYREVRNRDLDDLKRSGAEEQQLVHLLSKDLKSKHADVRLRAAQYLGMLGSGEAARHLVPVLLRDKNPEVREAVLSALTDIGGAKVAREIAKAKTKRVEAPLRGAIGVLTALASRSEVEARLASAALGSLVSCRLETISDEALSALEELGPAGLWGLLEAATIKNLQTRLRVLRALGETKDGRAGDILGGFLVYAAKGELREQRQAAIESIKRIGRPVVPYIARFLGNPRLRQWTALILRELTGRSFKTAKQAESWWQRNK